MNELLIYRNEGPKSDQGFKTILAGPAHEPYGKFCPAPGHGLGFNDLKTVEFAHFLQAIAGEVPAYPDFAAALRFERVIHAIARSAQEGTRVRAG